MGSTPFCIPALEQIPMLVIGRRLGYKGHRQLIMTWSLMGIDLASSLRLWLPLG